MLPNNVPEKKSNPVLILGLVFIAVGISMLGTNTPTPGGGIVFVILGIVFLAGYIASEKEKAEKKPGGFPTEPQIRENQSAKERELRKEALAPEERPDQAAGQTPPSWESTIRLSPDEIEQRKEELKSLLESGILTREEYGERMRELR